jgi:expansin (peptidoglycan-binding protein)
MVYGHPGEQGHRGEHPHLGSYGQHRRRGGIVSWLERRGLRRPLLGLGLTGAGAAAAVLAVVVGIGQASGTPACAAVLTGNALAAQAGGTVTGIATHYVLQGLPNCSYPNPPADQLFVALSPSEYANAGGCGGYLEVTGPDGSVRVKVIDQCPECATGHIDLSETAFARLAPLSAGLINVHYTYLSDPALPGPISIEVKDGSSQYWLALLADNTGNPLTSVQVRTSSGWQSLQLANYNFWIAQSGAGPGPFTVRLTDNQGNATTVSGISLSPGSTEGTGTYMYGAGSNPAPPTSAPPAAPSSAPASSAPASAPRTSRPTPPATIAAFPGGTASVSPSALVSRSPSASPSPSVRRSRPRATSTPRPRATTASPALTAVAAAAPAASATCG